jgi:hypothetical protein
MPSSIGHNFGSDRSPASERYRHRPVSTLLDLSFDRDYEFWGLHGKYEIILAGMML